jgi:transposase
MPKLLSARVPENTEEERKIRILAGSRHAPGDWIFRARIISLSWRGLRTAKIAEELGCHPKTVRKRLHRFNAEDLDGLTDRPGAGRKPRITEDERSRIIVLVSKETRRASCSPSPAAASRPKTRRRRPTGPWTHSPRARARWASR